MRQRLVVRRRRADDDIEAAFAYYLKEAGPEVASGFVNRFQEAVKRISRQPGVGSPRYGLEVGLPDLRHWPIKNFPYLIFYLEKEDRIEVARVLHSSADIPSWLGNI